MLLQDYQVIVDYPRQLHVLHNLMLQGKLTKEQCKNESKNFIEYVRDKCKKISLFSANCIFAGMVKFSLFIYCYILLLCSYIFTNVILLQLVCCRGNLNCWFPRYAEFYSTRYYIRY